MRTWQSFDLLLVLAGVYLVAQIVCLALMRKVAR